MGTETFLGKRGVFIMLHNELKKQCSMTGSEFVKFEDIGSGVVLRRGCPETYLLLKYTKT